MIYCKACENLCNIDPDGMVPDRLRELVEAYRDGRCVVSTLRVGNIVYQYNDVLNDIGQYEINTVYIAGFGIYYGAIWSKNGELMDDIQFEEEDIGKTVFLTRAEAEEALAKEGAENE